jgi:hypothetical protein
MLEEEVEVVFLMLLVFHPLQDYAPGGTGGGANGGPGAYTKWINKYWWWWGWISSTYCRY